MALIDGYSITVERGIGEVWYFFARPKLEVIWTLTRGWQCSKCVGAEGSRATNCRHVKAAKKVRLT